MNGDVYPGSRLAGKVKPCGGMDVRRIASPEGVPGLQFQRLSASETPFYSTHCDSQKRGEGAISPQALTSPCADHWLLDPCTASEMYILQRPVV